MVRGHTAWADLGFTERGGPIEETGGPIYRVLVGQMKGEARTRRHRRRWGRPPSEVGRFFKIIET